LRRIATTNIIPADEIVSDGFVADIRAEIAKQQLIRPSPAMNPGTRHLEYPVHHHSNVFWLRHSPESGGNVLSASRIL
jgi:hypothetical protein